MSNAKRLPVVGIVAASVGAVAGRVAAYRAMRNDLDAIRQDISRGLSSAAAIRNHSGSITRPMRQRLVELARSERDSISPPRTQRYS